MNCLYCGKDSGKNKYCDYLCKNKFWDKKRKVLQKEKNCKECGSVFMPVNSLNCYCGPECKYNSDLKRRSKKTGNKNCKFCNKEFEPYTSLDKFCSANCGVENEKSKRSRRWSKKCCNNRKGKNNPGYRHGMYSGNWDVNKMTYKQKEFIKNRSEIKSKMMDDHGYLLCENCFITNANKWETHHIVFRSEKPKHEQLHNKINLIHLCVQCHNDAHKSKHEWRAGLIEERSLIELFGNDILPLR